MLSRILAVAACDCLESGRGTTGAVGTGRRADDAVRTLAQIHTPEDAVGSAAEQAWVVENPTVLALAL